MVIRARKNQGNFCYIGFFFFSSISNILSFGSHFFFTVVVISVMGICSNGSSEVEHGNLEAICCFAKEVFGKSPEEFIDINCTEAKRYHAYSVAGLSLGVIILVIVIAIIIINYCW